MTAAAARAPFTHTPDGPSFRSKPGVEHFRRSDGTHSRAIRYRGAPMSPTGAAITPDALNTGLRRCQSESTNPVTIGSTGVQTRYGRDLVKIAAGRFREAGESTVINDTAGGALGKLLNAVGVRAHPFGQCQPVVDHPNRVDLRDMRAISIYSTAGHMLLGKTYHSATATNSAMGMQRRSARAAKRGPRALVAHPATRCCCFLIHAENRSVPTELATSESAEPHMVRQFSPDQVSVGV